MEKNLPASAGSTGSIPGSAQSPGEGNGNPLQYSCLGNPMDRGVWRGIDHGVARVGHDLATKQQQQVIQSHFLSLSLLTFLVSLAN